MPSSVQKYRHQAFLSQEHRCYYCGFLMWESSPEEFAAFHKISSSQAQRFKCTAEHLDARQDGGKNAKSNIVAACLHCNQTRHRMKPAPTPEVLRRAISKQLQNKCWHRKHVVQQLSSTVFG
jgi:5-methylcytosine-specific restriction endonuclease McrA